MTQKQIPPLPGKFSELKLYSTAATEYYTGLNSNQQRAAEQDGLTNPERRGSGKFIDINELGDLRRNRGKYL